MKDKPNIILFITHDQGTQLEIYNSPAHPVNVETPNIDGLAKRGVYFTNYFATAPQCSPSRASVQTGRYPHQNRVMGLIDQGWDIRKKEQITIPKYLKQIGYTTHLLGFQHESHKAKKIGYEKVSRRKREFGYSTTFMNKKYIRFLKKHKDDEKPFFVSIGTPESHRPFQLFAEPLKENSIVPPPYLANKKPVIREMREFYGTVKKVDKSIGLILKALEQFGLEDNTLFIYTTDHGIDMPRAKGTLYDPGIKTALIMYLKGSNVFSGGKKVDALLSNIDFLPTLIDFLGSDVNYWTIEGKSFLPILKGEKPSINEQIFAEKTYHVIYDPMRGIRTKDFKYIKNFPGTKRPNRQFHIPNDTFSYKSKKAIKSEYIGKRSPEELYDLNTDPYEKNNLAGNPEYETILLDLRNRLEKWMENTNDPLLYGRIKAPVGYIERRGKFLRNKLRKNFMTLLEHTINYKFFRVGIRKLMRYVA
jgi:arylsulfatase A-like enzyme